MKKTIMTGMFLVGTFVGAAFAAGPYTAPGHGVNGSLHDMNKIDAGNQDPEGRVCAFCHTPHHAISDPSGLPQPLWSHTYTDADPTKANMVAYQSPYYNLQIEDPLVGPSRLCMSCHDGVIAADQHYNMPGKNVITDDSFGGRAIGLKNAAGLYNFGNDHPIGFVYDDARAEANTSQNFENIFSSDKKYLDANLARNGKVIKETLYNGIMTCATCHDVHNKENVANVKASDRNYFVYAPQDSSALCISCHNKADNQ